VTAVVPALVGCVLLLGAAAQPVVAQRWSADVYAGGTRYAALGTQAAADAAALVAGLRFETPTSLAYLSAAAPLSEESPAWAALGGSLRLGRELGPARLGLQLAADGFAYRQADERTGSGASTRVQPFFSLSPGLLQLQLHGARSDYVIEENDASLQRHLYEIGGQASATVRATMIQTEVRHVTGEGGTWTVADVQLGRLVGPATAWVGAGHWFGDLDELTWLAGASLPLWRGTVWGSAQHTAADPLYLSPERTTWNIGFSLPLGRTGNVQPGPQVRDGEMVIRLARVGRAATGPIAVAGEFNDWTPVMMTPAGDTWEFRLPAVSGAYRFAFVDPAGDWFVPEGYPGRISDDMGGYVVLLVVP
jgi:hypothetical protein